MGYKVNFHFSFGSNSSDVGGFQQHPYRSTAASSSGEDLSTYDYGGLSSETYSSLEGDLSDLNFYSGYKDIDYIDDNPDMILPMPRIPTSSPGSKSSPVQPQLLVGTELEAYNLSLNLKWPHAPLAADLDTANLNILPSKHCHKQMKPARVPVTHTVTNSESQ